jgi:hypothetical protein
MDLNAQFNRRLTPREVAFVLLIAVLLAAITWLAWRTISAHNLQTKIDAAFPKVCDGVRDQRRILVKAIEDYKARFGTYPPDHVLSRQPMVVDPVTNTLLYELAGVLYNPTNKLVQAANLEPAEESFVLKFLNCDGFKNVSESAEKIPRFIKMDHMPICQLHDDPDVFLLGSPISDVALEPDVLVKFEMGSWRYVSSAPTHNPGTFDLWVEVKTPKRSSLIGNWKDAQ